jgi:hypothetical protein
MSFSNLSPKSRLFAASSLNMLRMSWMLCLIGAYPLAVPSNCQ